MSRDRYPCGDTCHGLCIPAEIHRIHWIEIIGLYTPEKYRLLSFVAVCSLVYHF
jgi:hypothetical protein